MTFRHWLPAGLLVPLLLGARGPRAEDVEALLRAGDDAFARGAHAQAAALYEKAEERSTEPGMAAFNLATAKFHLARDGSPQALAEAEQAYRCCLEPGDPRRPRALFGLGNCLLLRAAGTSLDRVALRQAIDRFGECFRDENCSSALAADARHNRQRARLLLLQAPSSPEGGPEEGSASDDAKDDPPEQKQPDGKGEPGTAEEQGNRGGSPSTARGGPEQPTGPNQGAPTAGQGALPPLADRSEPSPLTPNDALAHLEQATRRIMDEMRQHRRSRARPAGAGVRDW
jgi:hypothetical protein